MLYKHDLTYHFFGENLLSSFWVDLALAPTLKYAINSYILNFMLY